MSADVQGWGQRRYELTVIMTNYNQEAYLPMAVESVLAQVVDFPFKLVIADDCSCEDGSRELVCMYAREHENIEAVFADVHGGYLRNVIRVEEGMGTRYFCLLDADDYWTDTGFLQRAYDFLEAHGEYAIFESNVTVVSGEGKALRPFVSPKVRSGTYTKEMLLEGKRVPITQTTGMFLRNSIFSKGVPDVMKNAIGTRSERSFEGDTGRFVMHLKEGPVYYDSRVVGAYRLTEKGIWNKLPRAMQCLISARAAMDYYGYYGSHDAYFVNGAYAGLRRYLREKQDEVDCLGREDGFMGDDERLLAEDVYRFCKLHEGEISRERRGFLYKAKQVIRILRA